MSISFFDITDIEGFTTHELACVASAHYIEVRMLFTWK